MTEEAKNQPKKVQTPGTVMPSGSILEECWDGSRAYFYYKSAMPQFANDPPQRITEKFDAETNTTLIPRTDDLVNKGLVKLPSEPLEYESETKLYQDIKEFIKRWVDLGETEVKIQALWVMETWVYQKVPQLVINAIRAASESGKTRLAETIRHIAYRGMRSSGTLTYSSLFRTAEAWQGTVLVNEADMKGSDETNRIVKWLNESVDPNGAVWVTNPNTLEVECYRTFVPIILVSRKSFDDDALESRCNVTYMTETTRNDLPLNLPPAFYEEADKLRNQLLMFRFKNYHRFENDYTLRFNGVGSRLNQIMQPLGSLARMVSPEMFGEIEAISKECQARLVSDRAESQDGLVVRGYFSLEGTKKDITSSNISEEIGKMGHPEMSPSRVGRRLANLPFDKYSIGKEKPWRVRDKHREQMLQKYVPEDERRSSVQTGLDISEDKGGEPSPSDTFATTDTIYPQGAEANPTLSKKVQTIKNLITKRPTTIADIQTMLPESYIVALKLKESGEIITKPDGNLAVKA